MGLQVDVRHLAEQHRHVLAAAQDLAEAGVEIEAFGGNVELSRGDFEWIQIFMGEGRNVWTGAAR